MFDDLFRGKRPQTKEKNTFQMVTDERVSKEETMSLFSEKRRYLHCLWIWHSFWLLWCRLRVSFWEQNYWSNTVILYLLLMIFSPRPSRSLNVDQLSKKLWSKPNLMFVVVVYNMITYMLRPQFLENLTLSNKAPLLRQQPTQWFLQLLTWTWKTGNIWIRIRIIPTHFDI